MTAAEALGCQACGLPITPCLICASPIPVAGVNGPLLKTCRICGVVNPLGDKHREVLDIPPTSALPSAMVRRAQIARVGRRPYVLAKHAHFMHLRSVSKRKAEDEQHGGSEEPHGVAMRGISARQLPEVWGVFASAEEGHPVKSLPYMHDSVRSTLLDNLRVQADDGEVRSTAEGGKVSISLDGKPLEALHNVVEHEAGVANLHATSRIEPYLQTSPSAIHGLDSFKEVSKPPLLGKAALNVEDAQHHESGEAPTSAAANSTGSVDQRHKDLECSQVKVETSVELPSSSVQKVDAEGDFDAFGPEDHNPVRDGTGSEEVPTHRHERVCSECAQVGEGSGRLSRNVDEAEFMRCCTQILELYCPHTLKADVRTPCAYPLCCPIPRYPLPAGSKSSSKVCRSYVTQFTVDILKAAHPMLVSSTQESTSEEVASPLRGGDQALSMAERFIEIRGRMDCVQGLIQEVDAASAQASRDFKAYGDHGAFSLASQLIPRLLSREKQQNVERGKDDVQEMSTFLQDINKLLATCFQFVGKFLDAFLFSVDDCNHTTSNAVNLDVFMSDFDNKPGLEAVRTAIPLWLRMYHDVAHASGLLK